MDRKYGISGAQPHEVFEQTLLKAWEEHLQNNPVLNTVGMADGISCDVDGNCD
jgi:hypothetical protein